ncbi:MAG TPA: phage holin family protein [Candidatus Dormibacteraeota bacterium]
MEIRSVAAPKATSRELASEVVQDVQRLVDLELMLARQELKELAITNTIAVACMAAAGILAVLAALVGLPVLVVVAVPWHWAAALVWMIAYLVLAGGLFLFGRSRLRLHLPMKTLDSLKENKEWALHQLKSNGK